MDAEGFVRGVQFSFGHMEFEILIILTGRDVEKRGVSMSLAFGRGL